MLITFVFTLATSLRGHAVPFADPPAGAGVPERVLHFAGFGPRFDAELLGEFRAVLARVTLDVAAEFHLALFEVSRAVDLALDTRTLIARAFDGSLNPSGRPVRFEEDLRRAILDGVNRHQKGLRMIVDGAEALVRPRAEILRHLGAHDAGVPGPRVRFDDERWRPEVLGGAAWTDLPYTHLGEFAVAHLTKLSDLARARRVLVTLAPSDPRSSVLNAMDEVTDDLREQVLDLPAVVAETVKAERARVARRPRQQQQNSEARWHRLGATEPRVASADWRRMLADVVARHGFDRGLIWPGGSDARRCDAKLKSPGGAPGA